MTKSMWFAVETWRKVRSDLTGRAGLDAPLNDIMSHVRDEMDATQVTIIQQVVEPLVAVVKACSKHVEGDWTEDTRRALVSRLLDLLPAARRAMKEV